EIWHTASTGKKPPDTGWLGRILDTKFPPADLVPGLALSGSLPQSFEAAHWSVPVIHQLEAFVQPDDTRRVKLLRKLAVEPEAKAEPIGFLRHQAAGLFRTADKLRAAAAGYQPAAEYPGDLGNQLRRAAQVIAANLGVRLFFASQGGYDTHSQQVTT